MNTPKSSADCMYCVSHQPVALHNTNIQLLQVGGAKDNFASYRDNTGNNIAALNAGFSELTGHYWVWKNRPTETVGFCHYRRFLVPPVMTEWFRTHSDKPYSDRQPEGAGNYASGYQTGFQILTTKFAEIDYCAELNNALDGYDILLPEQNRVMQGGLIRQYARAHPIEPFYAMLTAIARIDNDLGTQALQFFTEHEYAHWNNLFFTRWELFNEYCDFQFEVLLSLNADDRKFSDVYQNRYCAFLSERLFNFWVWHKKLKVRQLDWCMTEDMEAARHEHQAGHARCAGPGSRKL